MADNLPEPKSRKESYLAKAAGMDTTIPENPESREEQYLAAIAEGGGGGGSGTKYQFRDTDNGWKVNGSDGSEFTHVDKGGSGGGGAITGQGAPTKNTEAELGQTYIDETNGEYYVLNSIDNNNYLWSKVDKEPFVEITKYAELKYYSVTSDTVEMEFGDGCTLQNADVEKYTQWLADNPEADHQGFVEFEWNPSNQYWEVWGSGETIIIRNIYETTGLNLIVDDPTSSAFCSISVTTTVDKESEVFTVNIIGQLQLNNLGTSGDIFTGLGENGDISVKKIAVQGIKFVDIPMTFPDYFLSGCVNLTDITTGSYGGIRLSYVSSIGDNFLYGCTSVGTDMQYIEITIRNLSSGNQTIGQGFLRNFGSNELEMVNITLNTGVVIGATFCQEIKCQSIQMTGNPAASIGDGFLSYCTNLVEVTGINGMLGGIEEIPNVVLSYCSNLTTITNGLYLPNAKEIGYNFLCGCEKFNSSVDLPKVTSIGHQFMAQNYDFTYRITLPSVVEVGSQFMQNCPKVPTMAFPNLKIIGAYFLNNNSTSEVVYPLYLDLPSVEQLSLENFCKNRKTGTVTFGNENILLEGMSNDALTNDVDGIDTTLYGPGASTVYNQLITAPPSSGQYRTLKLNQDGQKKTRVLNSVPTSNISAAPGDMWIYPDANRFFVCMGGTTGNYVWKEITLTSI